MISTCTGVGVAIAGEPSPVGETGFRFPTIPDAHRHATGLLANAINDLGPESRIMDPNSGYPFEGWNQEPARGIFLRSFIADGLRGDFLDLTITGLKITPRT